MKTKNIISLLLVLAMLMSVCACGSDTTPAAPNGSAETKPEYRITAKLTAADAENKELAAHLTENCVISFTNTSSDTWDKICLRDYAAANLELENSISDDKPYTPGSIREVKDSRGNALSFSVQEDKSVVYVQLPSPLKPGERTSVSIDYSTEIPCFFSPCGSYEMTLSAPEDYMVISTGSEAQSADGTWTLKADNVRDFAVIAGNGFEKLSGKAGNITVNSWYYSGSERDKKQGEVSLKAAIDAVNAFCDAWGEYPYDTLDVVQTPYNAGGMEYPGLVRIAEMYADLIEAEGDESLRLDVAHEVAHEWFYAVVGNDQYREAWLDESFAVYGEFVYQLYTGESETDVQARVDSLDCSIKQKYIDLSYDQYFDEYTGNSYINAVYKVGPVFLWKLRQTMGQESFDAFMRAWYEEHMFKEVTTAEFRAAIAKASDSADVKALLDEYLSPAK